MSETLASCNGSIEISDRPFITGGEIELKVCVVRPSSIWSQKKKKEKGWSRTYVALCAGCQAGVSQSDLVPSFLFG